MAANIQGRDPLEDSHYPNFIEEILRNERDSLRSGLNERTKDFLNEPFIRERLFSWAKNHSKDIENNPRLREIFKYISNPPVKKEAAALVSRTNAIATPVLEKGKEDAALPKKPATSPTASPFTPTHRASEAAIIREEITSSERFRKIMDRYTEENGIMVAKKGKISSQLTRSQLEEVIITAIKTAKEMRALGHLETAKSFEVAGFRFEVITRKVGSESLTILSSDHRYLGRGLSGSVTKAFSISGGQFRTIKEAEVSNPESRESLQKEYVILRHLWPMEGIPRPPRAMHHFSETSTTLTGFTRLRHEYIEGMTMEQAAWSTMPIPEKCRIAKQLIYTVLQMHEKGVAHQDIHLGNVMLSGDKVVVIDFGSAAIHSKTSPEDFYNKDIIDTLWLISHIFGSKHPLHDIVEAQGLEEALALIEKESEKYPEMMLKREAETSRRETASVSTAETSTETEEIRRSPSFLKAMNRYREMDGLMVSKKGNIALNLTKPQLEEAFIKALKISKEMRAAGHWEIAQSFEVAGHTFEVMTGKSGSDHISIYIKNLSKTLGAGKFETVQKVLMIDRYREMDGLMVSKKDNIALNLTKPQLEEAFIKALKISEEMREAGRWKTTQSFEVAGYTFEVMIGESGSDHVSIYIKSLSEKLGKGYFGNVQKVFSITGGDFRAQKAARVEARSLANMENEYRVLHHMGPTEGVITPPKRIYVISGSSDKSVVLSRTSTKLIEGSPLSTTIKKLQAAPLSVSLDVARQIIQIMIRLREKGVVHNDLQSGNFMVSFDSSGKPHVTLIDFGEATIRPPGHKDITGFHLHDLDQTCGLFKVIFLEDDALYNIGERILSLEEALALVDAEIIAESSDT